MGTFTHAHISFSYEYLLLSVYFRAGTGFSSYNISLTKVDLVELAF